MKLQRLVLGATILGAGFVAVGVFTFRAQAQSGLTLRSMTVTQRVVLESSSGGVTKIRTSTRLNAISPTAGIALLERDESFYPQVPGFHYRLLRLADGRKIDVFDPIQSKTTYYESTPGRVASHLAKLQGGNCVGGTFDTIEGRESILGVDVVRIRQTGKDREYTRWLAPAAGCIEIQKIAIWKNPDTGIAVGKTSYIPESVQLGEPVPGIFDIPSTFQEKAPDQVGLARLVYKYGSKEEALAKCPPCLKQSLQKDVVYEAMKSPKAEPSLVARLKQGLGF